MNSVWTAIVEATLRNCLPSFYETAWPRVRRRFHPYWLAQRRKNPDLL